MSLCHLLRSLISLPTGANNKGESKPSNGSGSPFVF